MAHTHIIAHLDHQDSTPVAIRAAHVLLNSLPKACSLLWGQLSQLSGFEIALNLRECARCRKCRGGSPQTGRDVDPCFREQVFDMAMAKRLVVHPEALAASRAIISGRASGVYCEVFVMR